MDTQIPITAHVRAATAAVPPDEMKVELRAADGSWAPVQFRVQEEIAADGKPTRRIILTVDTAGQHVVRTRVGDKTGAEVTVTATASAIVLPVDEVPAIDHPAVAKLGKSFDELNPGAPDDRTEYYATPDIPKTNAKLWGRVNPWNVGAENLTQNDYWSESGQIAYIPDDPKLPGLDRYQAFAHYHGVLATSPRRDISGGTPEPWVDAQPEYKKPRGVIAICRNQAQLSNEALVLWKNGLLTTAGTQTSRSGKDWPIPHLQLPAGLEPLALSLTTNNELACITLRDPARNTGVLAVVALQGAAIPFHTTPMLGFVNQGSWTRFVLLGTVDVPIAKPDCVDASSNGYWSSPGQTGGKSLGQIEWSDPVVGKSFISGEMNNQIAIADRGYCIIAGSEEKKVAIYNLHAVMDYFRQSWLIRYTETAQAWGAGEWPAMFKSDPKLAPTLHWQATLAGRITCVLAGKRLDRWSPDQSHNAYVATEDGTIHVIDASELKSRFSWEKKSRLSIVGSVQVGRNPTGMCFADFGTTVDGKKPDPLDGLFWVAVRGERCVKLVSVIQGQNPIGKVIRTISDKRLVDPVAVWVPGRGNILQVADFNGKKVHAFRIGNLEAAGVTPGTLDRKPNVISTKIVKVSGKDVERPTYGAGADGKDWIEYSGGLAVPGKPFDINTANVN